MSAAVVRAVLLTAFLCACTAYAVIRRGERKREGLPSRHPGRRHRPMAPRHPDRYAVLSDEHRSVWDGIEAGLLGDVGLAIFDTEDGASLWPSSAVTRAPGRTSRRIPPAPVPPAAEDAWGFGASRASGRGMEGDPCGSWEVKDSSDEEGTGQ